MESSDSQTQPTSQPIKIVKMTAKQIQKAKELSEKFLKEQEECLEEFKRMVENKEISIIDIVKSVKSYRKILDNRNKHSKIHYEKAKEQQEEIKGYYNSIKQRVEDYKQQLIKEEMEKANKQVLDLSNNLVKTERQPKVYRKSANTN